MPFIKTAVFVIICCMGVSACCHCSNENTYGVYADTLSYKTARQYVHHYSEKAGKVSHKGVDHLDSRTVWFSKGKLDSLISELKSQGGDGVRFYFATYDTVYNDTTSSPVGEHRPPEEYWGYNTLIMVSTYDSIGYHHDYFGGTHPRNANVKGGGFIVDVIQNDGELCPPPANCDAQGAVLLNY